MWMKGLPGRCGCWIGLTAKAEGITSDIDRSTRAYSDVDERPARLMRCWIGLTANDAVALACLRDDGLRTPRTEGITRERDINVNQLPNKKDKETLLKRSN